MAMQWLIDPAKTKDVLADLDDLQLMAGLDRIDEAEETVAYRVVTPDRDQLVLARGPYDAIEIAINKYLVPKADIIGVRKK